MQRYFVPANNFNENEAIIDGDDRHHIVNVMRRNTGDQIIVCHPDQQSYLGKITQVDSAGVHVFLEKYLDEQSELPIQVTIAQGLPKGDKLETIAQKGTELGMNRLIPVQMDRSIVKWDAKKENKKNQRLQKIVKEASEQSHRTTIPEIYPLMTIDQILNTLHFDYLLVASEYEAKQDGHPSTFSDVLGTIKENQHVLIIIGPEGGLTKEELANIEKNEGVPIRLGKRILRTETAPLYVLSALSFYFEEWS